MKSVDIILPVYNEEENLEPLVAEIHRALAPGDCRYRILLVDDGSVDASPEIIGRLCREDRRVAGVRLRENSGQTAAFIAGFRASRADCLVTMDADGQNDPADIPALLESLEECDLAAGYRLRRADRPARRWGSKLANAVRNRITGDEIIDTGCSLKAFRREVAEGIPPFRGMHRFFPTLARMNGYSVRQLPTNHRPRRAGRTKYSNLGRLKETVWDLWAVRWMQKRTVVCRINQAAPIPGTEKEDDGLAG